LIDLTDLGSELGDRLVELDSTACSDGQTIADRGQQPKVLGAEEASPRRCSEAQCQRGYWLPGGCSMVERLAQESDVVARGRLDPVREPRVEATQPGGRQARGGGLADEVVGQSRGPSGLDG
jgi:hypothetical protein